MSMEPEDIDICHRMKKGNHKQRPVIVRFSNNYSKEKCTRIVESFRGAETVFINENETAQGANLFKKYRVRSNLTTKMPGKMPGPHTFTRQS